MQGQQTGWKVGFGAVDITPPPGLKMAGFAARYQPGEGTHDPLRVRAVVFEDGKAAQPLLLLAFDLVGVSKTLVAAIRNDLNGKFNIDTGRIILAATHTHSGPVVNDDEGVEHGPLEKANLAGLVEKAALAAGQALANREAVTLELGKGIARDAGKNRSEIGGPTDPATGVLTVRSEATGELRGIVLNYTCHPTVLGPTNLLYTADYPFYTIQAVSEATSLPPERILFTQGACGDINAGHSAKMSINNPTAAGNRTYEAAAQLGGNVGKAAVEALNGTLSRLTPALEVTNLNVESEWQSQDWPEPDFLETYRAERQAELDQALVQGDAAAVSNQKLLKEWAETMLARPLNSSWPPPLFNIDVVRLGELTWVTVPGELFVEYGLALKQRLGGPAWILGYTNGTLGYIATPGAYERQDYEAHLAYRYHRYPAPFSSETGQRLVERVSELQKTRS